MNNSFPYDVETVGVLRKRFADAGDVLAWWESIGKSRYRYVATCYGTSRRKHGSLLFLDNGDWMFSNNKSALVKSALQWDQLQLRIVWRAYDPGHPVMGEREDDELWLEVPDGWWEIEGLPFGLTNFDIISGPFYFEAPGSALLGRSLPLEEVEKMLLEGIFATGGVVEENDGGLRTTHDIEFVDNRKWSIISIIQDDLSKAAEEQIT